jgi:hypothetical protein
VRNGVQICMKQLGKRLRAFYNFQIPIRRIEVFKAFCSHTVRLCHGAYLHALSLDKKPHQFITYNAHSMNLYEAVG